MGRPGKLTPNKPSAETLRREYLDERQASTILAAKYDVSFATICKWLKQYGIPARSFSDAKKLDWERWEHTDRLRLTAASRSVQNWANPTHDQQCQRAKGVEKHPPISKFERILMDALQPLGIFPVPQYAVDKYNIDLAIPEHMLAIEVHGGNWHNTQEKKRVLDAAKAKVLQSQGWTILIVKTRRQQWLNLGVELILKSLTQPPPNFL